MSDSETMAAGPTDPTRDELYRDWLGLRYSHPSYYGLLNVPELESDEEKIQQAGRKAKRKLRAYQIGTYRKLALELLTEIGQAVSVLTNAEKKRAYNGQLLARWKATVDELYRAHCEGAAHDEAVLEVWLKTCAGRGVPVTRLLPWMIRTLGPRLAEWPPHGGHDLPLPVNLWMYRDAVILGQSVAATSLERRATAVKQIQKLLGLSEGLARLVAEEITRDPPVFARMRIVAQARRDPMGLLVRLGLRVRRYGGQVGRFGKVVVAVAALLGIRKRNMAEAVERLSRERQKTTKAEAAPAAPRMRQRVRNASYRLRGLAADRPQGLVIAVAVLVGLAAVTLMLLVAMNVWAPWKKPEAGPAVKGHAGGDRRDAAAHPDAADIEAFKSFSQKYPAAYQAPLPEPELPDDLSALPSEDSEGKSATTFFGVPATKTPPKPPKKKPAATN